MPNIKKIQKNKYDFFRAARPCCKNVSKVASRSLPGTLRRPPGSMKSTNFSPQEAPRLPTSNFLGAPGPPRASPGRLRGGSRSRVGAQGPPRGLQGSILEGFWTIFASIFEPPSLQFQRFPTTCFRHLRFLCSLFFQLRVPMQWRSKHPLATKRLAKKGWSAVLAEP